MAVIFSNGQDGAATISADTNLGSSNFKQYTNLTVDSTKTLSGNYGMTLYVQQKLTLNGTISANVNGTAGGSVFIYARSVAGTGTVRANASGTGGGTAPVLEGVTSPSAAGAGGNAATTTAGAAGAVGGVFGIDEVGRIHRLGD